MPRIAVDNVEPDPIKNPPSQPVEVKPEKPKDHTAIVDESDPNGTNDLLKQKSSASIFSAFSAFPEKVTFKGEDKDETIILLMRAHIITNVRWIVICLLLFIVPLIFVPLLGTNVLPMGGPTSIVAFGLLWYMGIFTYAFINFLYWYFNVYILTNERVIDVDWYSVIFHNTDATRISKVQEVSSSHSGVFASIFDYGNVQVLTAGEEKNFVFENVPHPDLVSKRIQELMEYEEAQWEVHPPNE